MSNIYKINLSTENKQIDHYHEILVKIFNDDDKLKIYYKMKKLKNITNYFKDVIETIEIELSIDNRTNTIRTENNTNKIIKLINEVPSNTLKKILRCLHYILNCSNHMKHMEDVVSYVKNGKLTHRDFQIYDDNEEKINEKIKRPHKNIKKLHNKQKLIIEKLILKYMDTLKYIHPYVKVEFNYKLIDDDIIKKDNEFPDYPFYNENDLERRRVYYDILNNYDINLGNTYQYIKSQVNKLQNRIDKLLHGK